MKYFSIKWNFPFLRGCLQKINRKFHIAISGSYGGLNLGDEGILESILQELRSSCNHLDIVVFSRNPQDTEQRHHVRAVPNHEMQKEEMIEELKKLDLFILGGGGLLFDGVVDEYLRDVIWAKELNIPVMIYSISVGPLNSKESQKKVVEVLNQVDIITVRDSKSKGILQELGIEKEIEETADPTLLLNPQPLTKEMLEKEGISSGINVAFSVREPGIAAPNIDIEFFHNVLANSADFIIERFGAKVFFIPMEPVLDSLHSHAVISKMSNVQEAFVLKGKLHFHTNFGINAADVFCSGNATALFDICCNTVCPFHSFDLWIKNHRIFETFGNGSD